MEVLKTIQAFLSTPEGIALIVAVTSWVIKKFVIEKKKEWWESWSGLIVQTIKICDKVCQGKDSLAKYQWVFDTILKAIEAAQGKPLSEENKIQLGNVINLTHDELEKNKTL